MWFKSCPRCEKGDIVEGQDKFGRHIQCLQCGYVSEGGEVSSIGV